MQQTRRLNDQQIAELVVRGDPAGLNTIESRYGQFVVNYVRALAGEDSAVPDIVTEIFVSILQGIRNVFGKREDALALHVFETAVATLRREFAWVYEGEPNERRVFAVAEDLTRLKRASQGQLKDAMWSLVPEDRELLYLRYTMDFSYDQLSDILREARVNLEERLLDARLRFRNAALERAVALNGEAR